MSLANFHHNFSPLFPLFSFCDRTSIKTFFLCFSNFLYTHYAIGLTLYTQKYIILNHYHYYYQDIIHQKIIILHLFHNLYIYPRSLIVSNKASVGKQPDLII